CGRRHRCAPWLRSSSQFRGLERRRAAIATHAKGKIRGLSDAGWRLGPSGLRAIADEGARTVTLAVLGTREFDFSRLQREPLATRADLPRVPDCASLEGLGATRGQSAAARPFFAC